MLRLGPTILNGSAVVSLASPKTCTHSPKARLVVIRIDRRSYHSDSRLKRSSPPARSNCTNPNSSTITRLSLSKRLSIVVLTYTKEVLIIT